MDPEHCKKAKIAAASPVQSSNLVKEGKTRKN
jgi:hypothetical protein